MKFLLVGWMIFADGQYFINMGPYMSQSDCMKDAHLVVFPIKDAVEISVKCVQVK